MPEIYLASASQTLRDWLATLKEYREAGRETLAGVEMEIRRGRSAGRKSGRATA